MIESTGPAAVYVRISDDPELARLGVQRQERECRELAARLGWPVGQVYEDDDRSAFKRTVVRRQYQELLADIKAGKWSRLIVWHPDRMHRQPSELETFIEVVESAGVEIATVQAGTIDLTTPTGRMVARIVGATAAFESEHKAERIKAAMAEIAAAGGFSGGPRPFGWESDGLTEIPEEVDALREARNRVLAGESLRAIATDWNLRGVKPARTTTWQTTSIRKMLLAPRTIGLYAKKSGEVVGKAQWAPIFEPDDLKNLRAILRDPARNDRARRTGRKYLLTGGGLLLCGVCDAKLASRPAFAGRPDGYYGCKARGSGHVHIPMKFADSIVSAKVAERMSDPEFERQRTEAGGKPMAEAVAEMADVQERLNALGRIFGASQITETEWTETRKVLAARLLAAQQVLELGQSEQEIETQAIFDLMGPKHFDKMPFEWRWRAIRALVSRVVVKPHRGSVRTPDPDRVEVIWRH